MPVKELEFTFRISVESLIRAAVESNSSLDIKALANGAMSATPAAIRRIVLFINMTPVSRSITRRTVQRRTPPAFVDGAM